MGDEPLDRREGEVTWPEGIGERLTWGPGDVVYTRPPPGRRPTLRPTDPLETISWAQAWAHRRYFSCPAVTGDATRERC